MPEGFDVKRGQSPTSPSCSLRYNLLTLMTHEIVSIEEIVRRKSYKNSIDKMNVDIKSLINPDVPRYTNLLYAPNSQRLVGRPDLTKELKPLPKTVYLRNEANRAIRTDPPSRRSRENLVRTEVRPTPENSFR